MSTKAVSHKGRALSVFVERLVGDIGGGRYGPGAFVPSTRELAGLYDTSAETARRGLKLLQARGVLAAEGRSGFRVVEADDDRTCRPVAFVTTVDPALPQVQPTTAAIYLAFQAAGAQRDWPVLGAHACSGRIGAVGAQLRGSNAWGVILDTIDQEFYAAVVSCGLPTVMVNSWMEDSPVSTVLQDNYRGGYLAAEYLLKQGAKRIAWIGPASGFCHSRERHAGAGAYLRAAGKGIADRDCLESPDEATVSRVAMLLDRSDRPDGILALGEKAPAVVKRAADDRGMVIGRDFEMIGWVPEECYRSHYLPVFRGGAAAPAVVWSAATMTERALSLLAEVADGLVTEAVRLCVPTKLKLDEGNHHES
jgi:hypothetical protein